MGERSHKLVKDVELKEEIIHAMSKRIQNKKIELMKLRAMKRNVNRENISKSAAGAYEIKDKKNMDKRKKVLKNNIDFQSRSE